MNTKNLIFDIDGTLWDATSQITQAFNEVIANENADYPLLDEQLMASVMGMVIEDIAAIFFPYLDEEKRMELVFKCCANENNYLKTHGGRLYPQVIEVLQYLSDKGYQMFIVSNCQVGYVEALCTAYPLRKFFLDDECSGNTHLEKGENIKLIMERNHLKDAIYIGDTQKDKDACTKAGIPFIFASYGFGEVDAFHAKIDSFEELKALF